MRGDGGGESAELEEAQDIFIVASECVEGVCYRRLDQPFGREVWLAPKQELMNESTGSETAPHNIQHFDTITQW